MTLKTAFRNLLVCSMIAGAGFAAAQNEPLPVDQAAPDFTLTDSNGVEHSLSDFAGKTVVLEWFNYGCPFVVKHYGSGNMQGLQAQYAAREDVVWLTIVSSAPGQQGHLTPAGANAKIAEWEMKPTAVLIDEDGTVGKMFKAVTTPHMFVICGGGMLRYNGAIDDNRSADPSTIPGAKNYVAAALDALLAGNAVEVKTSQPYGCSVKYAN